MPTVFSNSYIMLGLSHIPSISASWEPTLLSIFVFLSGLVPILTLLWSLLQTFNHNPPAHFLRVWGQLFIYYFGLTMPFWMVFTLIIMVLSLLSLPLAILLLLVMSIYFYTTYLAPRYIKVKYVKNRVRGANDNESFPSNGKFAIIANLRLGLFSKPIQFQNLVRSVNQLEVDAVIIFGEWLYNPGADIVGQLMILKGINKPVYVSKSCSDRRYYPDNADLYLYEDSLEHAFKALGMTEVINSVPTPTQIFLMVKSTDLKASHQEESSLASLPLKKAPLETLPSEVLPSILLASHHKELAFYLTSTMLTPQTLLLTPKESVSAETNNKLAVKPKACEQRAEKTKILSKKTNRIETIPSFGQRGLPLRLSRPSITVLDLKVDKHTD